MANNRWMASKSAMTNFRTPFVAALTVIGFPLFAQEPAMVTDSEAYALYELLLAPMLTNVPTTLKNPLLLQRETAASFGGCRLPKSVPANWRPIVASYLEANSGAKWLQTGRMSIPYRLIPRAEIEADDARLALKFGREWNGGPPGSIAYARVSAVGFDPSKTKAVLHVGMMVQDGIFFMEKRNGVWVRSPEIHSCWGSA
jgi:hypothetical protein